LDPGFRILNPVSEFIDPVFHKKRSKTLGSVTEKMSVLSLFFAKNLFYKFEHRIQNSGFGIRNLG